MASKVTDYDVEFMGYFVAEERLEQGQRGIMNRCRGRENVGRGRENSGGGGDTDGTEQCRRSTLAPRGGPPSSARGACLESRIQDPTASLGGGTNAVGGCDVLVSGLGTVPTTAGLEQTGLTEHCLS